jgi:mono/diheme cytochrome c family protein
MTARQQETGRNDQVWSKTLVAGVLIFAVSTLVHSQAPRTVQDGVFAEAQAVRGQAIYLKQCAVCHGDKLEGAQGPHWRAMASSAPGSRNRCWNWPTRSASRCPPLPRAS